MWVGERLSEAPVVKTAGRVWEIDSSVTPRRRGIPQVLKPRLSAGPMRPKAEALGYLEASELQG